MIEQVTGSDRELIDRLVQIEHEAFGEIGLNQWTLMSFIRHGRVFCLREAGSAVALAEYMLDWNQPDRAYLLGVSVASAWQGLGFGTRLLEESFLRLEKEGIREVELTVDPNNRSAREVYERKLGFKTVEYREDEYGEGIHRLIMRVQFGEELRE